MWDLDFISETDFRTHVKNTIDEYKRTLQTSVSLEQFNKNIVDPVKFAFDKAIYGLSWHDLIKKEILRQKDKTINNSIGYFHQKIFQYIHREGCTIIVPENGSSAFSDKGGQSGWDVAFENDARIFIDNQTSVSRIYVEVKNKHNTMNSSASSKTFKKMQQQIVADDDCACFLVEAIAKHYQNINWVVGSANPNRRIRRVSIDEFYGIVTNDSHAFFKICMALPKIIRDVVGTETINPYTISQDAVYNDLEQMTLNSNRDEDLRMALAMYMLGFGSYLGFNRVTQAH